MNYLKKLKRTVATSDNNNSHYEDFPELLPVLKVKVVEPGYVYVIPIQTFPIREGERNNIKRFIDNLYKSYVKSVNINLFDCLGVIGEVLEFEVLKTIGEKSFDWNPQVAIALSPDLPPPRVPSREEAVSWKDGIPFHEIMPMISYMTRKSILPEAYDALFGCGGTIFYLSNLDEQKFFAGMKEVFGYKITDKSFQLMECLPVLKLDTLLSATSHQYRALYSVNGLYVAESMKDNGIIIVSDIRLDDQITELVSVLQDEKAESIFSVVNK